jgi:hypothetical protein
MKKQRIILIALLCIYTVAGAGIYRHDRKESDYTDLGAQPQFSCVGQIMHQGEMHGSCVLIGKKYVLSAAHVFILADHREVTTTGNGQTLTMNEPYNRHIGNADEYAVVFNGKQYKCKTLTVYPRYLDTITKDGLDIALLELEEPVTGITPATISTGYNELHADVTGVGWGVYGRADKPGEIVMGEPKKLGGENVIDSIGGYVLDNRPTAMFCDFDHPTDTTCNKLGSAAPRNLEYICGGGDSGGGLFRQTKTGWELVGICHGSALNVNQLIKTGYYGQVMSWMRVSVFADWIRKNEG